MQSSTRSRALVLVAAQQAEQQAAQQASSHLTVLMLSTDAQLTLAAGALAQVQAAQWLPSSTPGRMQQRRQVLSPRWPPRGTCLQMAILLHQQSRCHILHSPQLPRTSSSWELAAMPPCPRRRRSLWHCRLDPRHLEHSKLVLQVPQRGVCCQAPHLQACARLLQLLLRPCAAASRQLLHRLRSPQCLQALQQACLLEGRRPAAALQPQQAACLQQCREHCQRSSQQSCLPLAASRAALRRHHLQHPPLRAQQ
jgi:hypothetical protein